MKFLFTTFLVFFCYMAVAQGNIFSRWTTSKSKSQNSSEKLDKEYGFKGIILESNYNSFDNMKLVNDEGNTKYYTRTTDELKIDGIEVHSIKYCFYKNKLMMISITTKGLTSSQGLLNILQADFGEGAKDKNGNYFIMGEKVKLNYLKDPNTHEAELSIMSLPMTSTMFQDE